MIPTAKNLSKLATSKNQRVWKDNDDRLYLFGERSVEEYGFATTITLGNDYHSVLVNPVPRSRIENQTADDLNPVNVPFTIQNVRTGAKIQVFVAMYVSIKGRRSSVAVLKKI